MHKPYVLLCMLFCFSLVSAQQESFDYFTPPEDASEAEILEILDSLQQKLTHDYYKNNYVDVLKYGDLGFKLAERIKNLEWEVEIAKYTGSALVKMKDTLRAQKTFTESLQKAQIINDSTLIADAFNNLGNLNNEIGTDEKAIEYYNEAVKIYKAKQNITRVFVLNFNLSGISIESMYFSSTFTCLLDFSTFF
ncbi:MAG: tetratricopeptide repeat protein [Bacteroidota bacterium]